MTAPAPSPSRPRRRRRWLFVCVLLAMLWLMLEAAAFLGYSALRGELFSFTKLHAAQAERAKLATATAAGPTLAMQDSGGDTCIHPYLGFVANHDTDDQLLHWLKDHAVTRWGFVDQQGIVRKRDPRAVLIGLFGGSVAEFFGDDGADELAKTLRADARFADKRIEFVRMGLGGFKQPQQLFALTYLLSLGGELDYALNIDGFNEATLGPLENAPRGVPTFFPRNWSLLAEAAPDPRQRRRIGAHTVFEGWRQDLAGGFLAGPWRWSVIGNVVWDALDRWLAQQAAAQLLALQSEVRRDLPFHITGPGAEPGDDEARAQTTLSTWARCSAAMHTICGAHGIRYYHFLQPNQYLPDSKQLTAQERSEAFDPNSRYRPWVERTYPKQRAQAAQLQAQGVRFADMTQVFAAVRDTVYVDNCCHYNAEGNRILGRALAQVILRDLGPTGPPQPLAMSALRAEPAALRCTAPLGKHELRVFAATAQGEREVTYAETVYTSADPKVASVDALGAVTALAHGQTTITATLAGRTVSVPVEVALAPIVDLGGGYAPRPLTTPTLRAQQDGEQLTLHIRGPGLPGAVTFAATPAPRPYCGGRAVVPLQGVDVEALPASDGEVRVPLRMPPGVRSVYVQAVYRVSGEVCGFAISNALVVTR